MGHPVTDGGTFGMMAGENPMHPAKVEATHENLKAHLKSLGLQFHETEGKYGTPERSVIIYKPRRDQMTTLGKMFGQDSVIWSQGGKHELVYTNGAQEGQSLTTHPNQPPHEWFADQPEDYYTKIPGHGYFRINFNFGEPTAKAEKPVPVKHFSVKDNLTELDPKFQGTGMVGAEKNRPNRLPRTYFYHRNAAPEGVVTAGAAHEYHGELPTGTKLYNMGQDELGLNKPSWKQTKQGQIYHTPDLDTVERTLARKGYHGYENYGVDGALAYFHKLPVNRVQASRSPILKRSKLKKAWPKTDAENEPDRAAWARSPLNRLKKALPSGAKLNVDGPIGDQTANNENRQGFPGSAQHMVMEDAGGGPQNRGTNPVAPTHGAVTGLLQQIGNTGEKPGHNHLVRHLVRYSGAKDANRVADAERGWSTNTDEMFFDNPEEPARASVRPNGASHNLAPGFANQLNENDELDRRNERRFWSHPNFYEWHDTHTSHHNPRPWDKQQAIETARELGLIKNDQAAGVGTPRYAEFASPYGTVNPGQKSNLLHYDYHNKLQDVAGVVARHGFKTYYAGGQHGKPDLAHRNYDTGHLMIYDPTPQSGGDFGERNYTDAWRQMHELSHALTHHDVNKVYGEARRIGALGQHRTLHEAQRSVHWEWLAAHKQRELNKQIGIHVPDETFHKELNTIMHDAVHRAVTGKFTEPSQEGFTPHSHKVPLEVALDTVRKEGTRLGLAGHHELIRKHEPRPMVKFIKALPKK